jgi:hypothetical protein
VTNSNMLDLAGLRGSLVPLSQSDVMRTVAEDLGVWRLLQHAPGSRARDPPWRRTTRRRPNGQSWRLEFGVVGRTSRS